MTMVLCQHCGKEFYTKPFYLKRGLGKFCSRTCHHAKMRKRSCVKCATCKKTVERTPSQLIGSKSKTFFCSKSCQTLWRNKYFSGKRHKRWKGGVGVSYRSRVDSSGRKKICARCNELDYRILAVHHLDEDRMNNHLENLVYLCHNCHHLIHRDKVEKRLFNKKLK